jgi:hypothetical protein
MAVMIIGPVPPLADVVNAAADEGVVPLALRDSSHRGSAASLNGVMSMRPSRRSSAPQWIKQDLRYCTHASKHMTSSVVPQSLTTFSSIAAPLLRPRVK